VNWIALQEAVRLAVANATGLTDTEVNAGFPIKRVEWANHATAGAFKSGPLAFLTLKSVRGQGVDEVRQEYDSDTDQNVTTQSGIRLFTVSVSIQNDSQRPGEETVGALAGVLRTRLRRASVMRVLQNAGIATLQILPTVNADYRDSDGRWSSSSVTDLALSAAENDLDTTDAGDYVATAAGSSEGLTPSAGFDTDV
jgi:hypothetical protein